MTPDDLSTPAIPPVPGGPRVLFGFSPAQAVAEVQRCRGEDDAAYRRWQQEGARRLDQQSALAARRSVAMASLESARAMAAMLRVEVARARRNAQYVERAAQIEVDREIAELQARHAARVQEAQRMLLLASQRRLDLEGALARLADRLEDCAREMVDAGMPAAPRVVGEEGVGRLLAKLAGRDSVDVPQAELDRGREVARVPVSDWKVAVTTRAGTRLGTLATVVQREDDGRVVGYELAEPTEGGRWIEADDVVGIEPGALVVRVRKAVAHPYQDGLEPQPLRLVSDPVRVAARRSAMRRGRPGAAGAASGERSEASERAMASATTTRLPVPALRVEASEDGEGQPASVAVGQGAVWGDADGRADLADWLPARPQPGPSLTPAPPARASYPPVPQQGPPAGTGVVGENPTGATVATEVLAFMNGKVVGQEIVAADGQVVARRGERIDAALVDRVERAGRLPELIVYMTFDDDA